MTLRSRHSKAKPGARSGSFGALVVALGTHACARAGAAPELALPTSPDGTLAGHGPGVAIDRPLVLAPPAPSAAAENGVVVLAAPADLRPARRTVEAFFDAVVSESMEGLDAVLDRAAHTTSPGGRKEAARPSWERRFKVLDYKGLASEVLFRPSELELHAATDASRPGGAVALPFSPRGDEVVIRVPLLLPRAARFFGNEIVFLLRPAPGGYKIGELFEDFRLP